MLRRLDIVARFQVLCRPERTEEMAAAIAAVEAPSGAIPGVVHFDVARGLTDPDTFVVIEVFENRQALERQNAQGEVAKVLSLIEAGTLTADYEWTVWETSAAE
jgi:quinol monooxygenase YgiN